MTGGGLGGLSRMFKSKHDAINNTLLQINSRLSLRIMTLRPACDNVETAQGVPLNVTGVAQVYKCVYKR